MFDLIRLLPALHRDLLETSRRTLANYGDVVRLPLRYPLFILKHPEDIRHVLVVNQSNYHKTGALRMGHRLFGKGLLSSEDELHRRQRRVMQPMFHQNSVAGFAQVMVDATESMVKKWRHGQVVDMAQEMARLTLTIIGRLLFSIDLTVEAPELHRLFVLAQRHIERQLHNPLRFTNKYLPGNRRYERAMRRFDELVAQLLQDARRQQGSRNDLLSLMLDARFEDGEPMSDRQIRDEVVTLLLAGHETVAAAITWTWYLLAQHPEIESNLSDELQDVLGSRRPAATDYAELGLCRKIFSEVLRLYPSAWHVGRRAREEDSLPSGYVIPARAEILVNIYTLHRDARFFPSPDSFDPERFTVERTRERPRYAYIPFGAGSRSCIGEGLARMEGVMLMAEIARHWRLRLVPDQRVALEPLITLRPKYGIQMRVERR